MTTINKMHTTVAFGRDNTVSLLNIEDEQITEFITVPCAPWADRHAMAEVMKQVGRERDLY